MIMLVGRMTESSKHSNKFCSLRDGEEAVRKLHHSTHFSRVSGRIYCLMEKIWAKA
jgi:hypothetical protein